MEIGPTQIALFPCYVNMNSVQCECAIFHMEKRKMILRGK